MDIIKSMNNDIDKNMVILHIENYVVCQKEDDLYDGFILCNFEYDDVITNDLYEELDDIDVLIHQYTNVEKIEKNGPTAAIMSSSTLFIDGVFKEEDTTINETQEKCLEVSYETEQEFQEEQVDTSEIEPMTSSTSSVDTDEEQELENQLIYYKTSIQQFECDIQLYEKMLSGLIYKNISFYKYKFILVNNNNTYTSITRKIEALKISKKIYEKTLEDILKLQFNDKNSAKE